MIFFLVKVFQEQDHADDFIRGKMFANRLCYFKKLEDQDGRGDEEEGAIMPFGENLILTLKPTNVETGEVDKITITKDDLAAPLVIVPRWFDHFNLFCMYAAHSDGFRHVSFDNVQDIQNLFKIPADYTRLGRHAVFVTNISEFIDRVTRAADRRGYRVFRRLVKYYDPETGTPSSQSEMDTIFTKRSEYKYQNEYRIAIDTRTTGSDPLILDIGGIDDIAVRINTSDINCQLRVNIQQ